LLAGKFPGVGEGGKRQENGATGKTSTRADDHPHWVLRYILDTYASRRQVEGRVQSWI